MFPLRRLNTCWAVVAAFLAVVSMTLMMMVSFNRREESENQDINVVESEVELDKRFFVIGSPDLDVNLYDEDAELADLYSPTGTVVDSIFPINLASWDDLIYATFIPQLDVEYGVTFQKLQEAFVYIRNGHFSQDIPIQIQDPAAGPAGFGSSPLQLFQSRRLPWLVPQGSNFKAIVSSLRFSDFFQAPFQLPYNLWIFPESGSQLSVPDFRHNKNFQTNFYVAPVFRFQNKLLVLDPSMNQATYILASDWIKLIKGASYAALCDVQAVYPTSQCENLLYGVPTPIPFGPAREERLNLIINSLFYTYQLEFNLEMDYYQNHLGYTPYVAQQHVMSDIDFTIFCITDAFTTVCTNPNAAISVDVITGFGNSLLAQPTPSNNLPMVEDATHTDAWLNLEIKEFLEQCSLPPAVAAPIPATGFVNCPNGHSTCHYALMEQYMINARRGDILVIVHAELECGQIPADGNSPGLESLVSSGICDVLNLNRILIDGGPSLDGSKTVSSFASLTTYVNHFQGFPIIQDGTAESYFFSHVVITHIDIDHTTGIVGLLRLGAVGSAGNRFAIAPLSTATIFYFADPAGFLAPGTACPGGKDIYDELKTRLAAYTVLTPEVDLQFKTANSLMTIHWIGPKKNQFAAWATYAAKACAGPKSDSHSRNALSIVFEATLSVADYITDPANPHYAAPFVSALYTGDMNIEAVQQYVTVTPSLFSGSYDYIKAPHHGSAESWKTTNTPNPQAFFTTFSKIGLHMISAESRRYTHPNAAYMDGVFSAHSDTQFYLTNKMRPSEKLLLSSGAQAKVVEGVNGNADTPVIYRIFSNGAVVRSA
ncbi:hypothetical protein HDU76_001752 [Blyttiomyces sp. JEL0837]|nr:hypothetical protein HDU76_001752 [Blyttiomyces sp. JEL0837]